MDYSENYLKIQQLMKSYHSATLKNNYAKATQIAHELADETIKLEFSTYDQVRRMWIGK
jgi:hypothetical protein